MLTIAACAKRSSSDSLERPAEAGATGGADDLADLELQLAQRETELRQIGIEAPGRANRDAEPTPRQSNHDAETTADSIAVAPSATSESSPPLQKAKPEVQSDRCQQVCAISTAICELEQQICGLLPRHPGDDRYQAACDRSVADCQVSSEACNVCTAN